MMLKTIFKSFSFQINLRRWHRDFPYTFLNLCILKQIRELFQTLLFQKFPSAPFLLFYCFGAPVKDMLAHLILSNMSPRLCSFCKNTFSPCYSDGITSINLFKNVKTQNFDSINLSLRPPSKFSISTSVFKFPLHFFFLLWRFPISPIVNMTFSFKSFKHIRKSDFKVFIS